MNLLLALAGVALVLAAVALLFGLVGGLLAGGLGCLGLAAARDANERRRGAVRR